jgi:hypothetical protein
MKRYSSYEVTDIRADGFSKLVVVVSAIIQRRSPLSLGNVMGSMFSNILGAMLSWWDGF